MGKIRHINKKKKADQQSALLALAADRTVSTGKCLSSAEMAGLVEERFEQEMHQKLLAHLSHCEDCYQEWLALRSQLLQDQQSGKKEKGGIILPFLSRPRNLAIFGSALAAVASVVMVVNIQLSNQPITYHEEKAVIQAEKKEIADTGKEVEAAREAEEILRASRQQERHRQKLQPLKTRAAPAAIEKKQVAPEIEPMAAGQKDVFLDVEQRVSKKKSVAQPPRQPQEERSFKKGGIVGKIREEKIISPEPSPPENRRVAKSKTTQQKPDRSTRNILKEVKTDAAVYQGVDPAVTSGDWLQQVEEGCAKNSFNEEFWKQLVVLAERLQQHQKDGSTNERFGKVVACVKEIDEQTFREICREIEQIIKKNK